MFEYPKIAVLFMTYNRAEYAERTLEAFIKNIRYDTIPHWYFADSGSEDEQYVNHIARINEIGGDLILGGHTGDTPMNPGVSWNKGIEAIFAKEYPIYLRLEDDFVLNEPLDLRPYVKLLMEQKHVGQVRLGLYPINLNANSVGYDGRMYLHVSKNSQYAYSGNPCLIHKRFHDTYGLYDKELGPGDCELAMDTKVRRFEGPAVYWPMELNPLGIWGHIGEKQSYQ